MLFRWHSRCQVSSTSNISTSSTHVQYCSGSLSLRLCLKKEKYYIYMRWTLSFPHITKTITQTSAHLSPVRTSVSISDLIPLLPTWLKIKASCDSEVCLCLSRKKCWSLSSELTSTTTTSTLTLGGKSSSGWKHFTMATSRWIVARRSLLWMTDRRAAE